MSAEVVLLGIMIGVLWLATLWSWTLRNWRAVSFLVAATAAILTAGLLPESVQPWVRAAMWASALLVVLMRNGAISTLRSEDQRFVEAYDGDLRRITELKSQAMSTEPTDYVAQLETIVASIEALEAPSREWSDLRAETVAELRRRLAMMRLRHEPTDEDLAYADEQWSAIERRFRNTIKAKSRFRRYWPTFESVE